MTISLLSKFLVNLVRCLEYSTELTSSRKVVISSLIRPSSRMARRREMNDWSRMNTWWGRFEGVERSLHSCSVWGGMRS